MLTPPAPQPELKPRLFDPDPQGVLSEKLCGGWRVLPKTQPLPRPIRAMQVSG